MSGTYTDDKTGEQTKLKETLWVHVWDEDLDFSDDYDGIISWLMDTDNEPMCWLNRNKDGKFSVIDKYEEEYYDKGCPELEELQNLCDALNEADDWDNMRDALDMTGMNGCDWSADNNYKEIRK